MFRILLQLEDNDDVSVSVGENDDDNTSIYRILGYLGFWQELAFYLIL